MMGIGAVLAAAIAFTACSGAKEVTPDAAEVTAAVLEQVQFSSELQQASDSTAQTVFSLPDGVTVGLYLGNGAFADELAVFACSDSSDMTAVSETVQQHLADLKASFEDYMPDEVNKIETAVVSSKGNCLVLCITDDAANAEKVIEEQLK
jgi:hypothetical protein